MVSNIENVHVTYYESRIEFALTFGGLRLWYLNDAPSTGCSLASIVAAAVTAVTAVAAALPFNSKCSIKEICNSMQGP